MREAPRNRVAALESRVAELLDRPGAELARGFDQLRREYPRQATLLHRWEQMLSAVDEVGRPASFASMLVQAAHAETGDPCVPDAEDGPSGVSPPAVPGVAITRRLGRGGMGVVYEGEQESPRRRVVVKVLRAGSVLHEAQMMADALARAPSGICQIYAVGESAGRPYLLMQYIEGRSLEELLSSEGAWEAANRGPAPGASDRAAIAAAADLVERVARALDEAHEAGVIHGDVKPSNIMVKPDGRPVVIDFGLANLASEGTLRGGTPHYMAPEQLRRENVDRRADVFGLGATLFRLLTGTPPLLGATDRLRTPPSPRTINPAIPADLAAVCLKACEARREDRYATAAGFAADLRAALGHRPVRARPPSVRRRAELFVRRHPIASGLVAAVLIGSASLWWALRESHRSAVRAAEMAHASYARWAQALARGEQPDPADELTVRRFADESTLELLSSNPASPAAFAAFARGVLGSLRGDEEWMFPDGDIRAAPPITFRVRGLTAKREPGSAVAVRLMSEDAEDWEHEFEVDAPGDTRDLEFRLPDGVVLDGGGQGEAWIWQLGVTGRDGRRMWRRYASFSAVGPSFRAGVLDGIRPTGDASLDRMLRGAALLAASVPEDAVLELEEPPSADADTPLAVLHRQLLVRALAAVDPERAGELLQEPDPRAEDR